MLTKEEIDERFDKLGKYLRWLIAIGFFETWDILMEVLRTDPYYICRREIK